MSRHISYRAESRQDYGTFVADDKPVTLDRDQIRLGAALRIADASEQLVKRLDTLLTGHVKLEQQVKRTGELYDATCRTLEVERRRVAALRGIINRQKRQLATQKGA